MNSTIRNIVLDSAKKYILDEVNNAVVAYSLDKLTKKSTSPCILSFSDGSPNMTVPFKNNTFDKAGVENYINRNRLEDSQLGIDRNSDGISDGWSFPAGTVTIASKSIDDSAQKIMITNANITTASATLQKTTGLNFPEGTNITFTVKYKTDNMYSRVGITTVPNATALNAISSLESVGVYTTITINATIPVGQTGIQIFLAARAKNVGDTGSVWYREASLTVSSVSAYIQQFTDQSGNGNHTIQNTQANKPRIFNNGTWETDSNGKLRIYFDGVSDLLYKEGLSISNIFGLSYVGSTAQTALSKRLISLTSDIPANNTYLTPSYDGTDDYNIGERLPNTRVTVNPIGLDYSTKSMILSHNRISTTYMETYSNGGNLNTQTNTTVDFNITRIYLGGDSSQGESYLQEYIIFKSPLTDTKRKKIEKSQGQRYNITVSS